MLSLRRQLLALLRRGPSTLHDLAAELGLREGDVADHLAHALRTARAHERLHEEPARCLSCGFVFRKREKVTTPSRCPRCRSERVQPATFRIEGEGE
ncbi:MAG: ArsR family transcriptional regulator [Deltaproteobacteria bacterium]|nr:ArsR family transcriptional regulator [Deltaproteobacteria bacterium]